MTLTWAQDHALGRVETARSRVRQIMWLTDVFEQHVREGADELKAIAKIMDDLTTKELDGIIDRLEATARNIVPSAFLPAGGKPIIGRHVPKEEQVNQ